MRAIWGLLAIAVLLVVIGVGLGSRIHYVKQETNQVYVDPALLEPLYFKVVDDTIAYLTKYEILQLTDAEQIKIAKLLVIRQFGFPVPVAKELMIDNLPGWAVERGKDVR